MNPELFGAGLTLSAVALIGGGFVLLVTGSARALGEAFRVAIEPTLAQVRSCTDRSRSELADLSILVAIAMATLAILGGDVLVGAIVGPLLYMARPAIRRATSQEHRLLAISGTFGIDLMIGVYLPFVLAHVLLAEWFMASCLLAVVVALSWPAGGGESIPGRKWQLAPIPT